MVSWIGNETLRACQSDAPGALCPMIPVVLPLRVRRRRQGRGTSATTDCPTSFNERHIASFPARKIPLEAAASDSNGEYSGETNVPVGKRICRTIGAVQWVCGSSVQSWDCCGVLHADRIVRLDPVSPPTYLLRCAWGFLRRAQPPDAVDRKRNTAFASTPRIAPGGLSYGSRLYLPAYRAGRRFWSRRTSATPCWDGDGLSEVS